jgi:hypothetical protein
MARLAVRILQHEAYSSVAQDMIAPSSLIVVKTVSAGFFATRMVSS